MLEIVNLTHGQILNRFDGREDGTSLTVPVHGIAHPGSTVTVNGVPTRRSGQGFFGEAVLRAKLNEIVVRSEGDRGVQENRIRVMWDKGSFRRTNFCVDDCIFFLSEIARERPKSLFDHFFLRGFRELHEKYGMRVTLNLFYRNDHFPFELADFPADYKREWAQNADWLRLAFHGFSEFPDRPYQNSAPGKIAGDYDLIRDEVFRFAGEGSLNCPSNIHWGMAKPASIAELCKRGVRYQSDSYINAQTYIGEENSGVNTTDIGFFLNEEDSLFIQQNQARYDERHGMIFGLDHVICNLEELPVLEKHIAQLIADPRNEALNLITHEQYFFPFYENYLPDHWQRLELTAKMLASAGYKYCFFCEGLMGNPAWENGI